MGAARPNSTSRKARTRSAGRGSPATPSATTRCGSSSTPSPTTWPIFLRTPALPADVEHWSLNTLREKLVKIGARIVRHGRYVVFQLAEVAVPRALLPRSCAGSTSLGRDLFTHDRGALDTGIGREMCPESAGQQRRRLGWHICHGRDAAWGGWHHPSMPQRLARGAKGAQWPLWNRYLGNSGSKGSEQPVGLRRLACRAGTAQSRHSEAGGSSRPERLSGG